ncbi:hypothetical protein VSQ48_23090 [Candidatus Ventrimonas sp. KK005]
MAETYQGQNWEQQRVANEKARQEAKERYVKEARRLYRDMTAEQAVKELKKLERGTGIFGWLRNRWDGFWNMVKTAMYSVLLGRQAAERRILSGNREESLKLQGEEAKKEAKISVLEEKIKEWETKEPGEKKSDGKERETENVPGPNQESTEHQEPEPGNGDPSASNDLEKETEAEPERGNEESNRKKPGDFSRFGIQCEQVTECYQKGLAAFLEDQMGIGEGNIRVANGSKNSIQISLWPSDEEKPRFCVEINPNGSVYYPSGTLGEDKISRAFQGALLKSALYYTAKVYDCAKDQELSRYGFEPGRISIKPGTAPSVEMIEKLLDKETAYVFGHKMDCRQGKDGAVVRLDGKRISLKAGQTVGEAVQGAMREKISADYKKISEFSKRMNLFAQKEGSPFHDLAQSQTYSCEEITGMVQKMVQNRTTDGSPEMSRTDILCGHLITLQTEQVSSDPEHKDYRRVISAQIDGRTVYQAARFEQTENVRELRAILQRKHMEAGTALWNSLCMTLDGERKLLFSEKTKQIHEALAGRAGQITDLDPQSGQRPDPMASCIREGDVQTVKELLLLGHEEDIKHSCKYMGPEPLTTEMAWLLELYGLTDGRENSQEEKEVSASLEQDMPDNFREHNPENEK